MWYSRNMSTRDPISDGRRIRTQRSRERILNAVAEALRDPDMEITIPEIAARSGVSASTIFRHFKDRDGLTEAMTERMAARVMKYLDQGPIEAEKLEDRIVTLVRRRVALFEEIGPLLRAGANPVGRRAHHRSERKQLEGVLANESHQALQPALKALSNAESKAVLEAVGILLSADSWAHLRTVRGHGVRASEAILTRALQALTSAS